MPPSILPTGLTSVSVQALRLSCLCVGNSKASGLVPLQCLPPAVCRGIGAPSLLFALAGVLARPSSKAHR